jgi:hypothetical protein
MRARVRHAVIAVVGEMRDELRLSLISLVFIIPEVCGRDH